MEKQPFSMVNAKKWWGFFRDPLYVGIAIIQIFTWTVILLDSLGLGLGFWREAICFGYLIIVPGTLLFRILKLNARNLTLTCLFIVGLSVATLMVAGLLISLISLILNIPVPYSPNIIIPTICVVNFGLFSASILTYKYENYPKSIPLGEIYSQKKVLLILTLPAMPILGAYLLNIYNINALNILFIFVTTAIILIYGLKNNLQEREYAILIFSLSLSLLLFTSLISEYIWGWDIHLEYYLANLPLSNGYWDHSIPTNTNAMLSIVALAPILSIFCDLSLHSVFKVCFQIIYAFVPLGLYELYRRLTSERIAFFSVLFFITTFSFYTEMVSLARQEIAELFFVLLLLVIIVDNISKFQTAILWIVFAFSLIVSHYTTSFIFLFCLLIAYLILTLGRNDKINQLLSKVTDFFDSIKDNLNKPNQIEVNKSKALYRLKNYFVLLYVLLVFTWFMYISSASAYTKMINVVDSIYSQIASDVLNPKSVHGLHVIVSNQPIMHQITKILHIIAQVFLSIGLLIVVFWRTRYPNIRLEYFAFIIPMFSLLILSLTVPNFSNQVMTSRMYHWSQLILSPLFVIGFIAVATTIGKTIFNWKEMAVQRGVYAVLSIFLAVFFMFNSGIMYYINDEMKTSASLIAFDNEYDFARYDIEDYCGAYWLQNHIKEGDIIYGDDFRWLLLASFNWKNVPEGLPSKMDGRFNSSLLYLGNYNTKYNELWSFKDGYIDLQPILLPRDSIYVNGGSSIYY
jgi:uncharacterized membrane protein